MLNQDYVNSRFVELVKSAETRPDVENFTTAFLRSKIREDSFFRQILPPVIITPAECDLSVAHEELTKIIEKEPDAEAYAINFRGAAPARYWEGEKYEIPFFKVESEEIQKKEAELLSYRMPVTDLIRKNTNYAIGDTEDSAFMEAVAAAIVASGKTTESTAATGFQKKDFVNLMNLIDGDRLKAAILLVSSVVYNDLAAWDDSALGDQLLSEVTVNGYNHPVLMGRRLVVTSKSDILDETAIYAFTDQPYLGHAYALSEEIRFAIETRFDLFSFKAWEILAAGIGNSKAVAQVTLKDSEG